VHHLRFPDGAKWELLQVRQLRRNERLLVTSERVLSAKPNDYGSSSTHHYFSAACEPLDGYTVDSLDTMV